MLEIRHLYKTYENQPLLQDISFSLGAQETLCLLGRSGSGKSTLLRITAGLEQPESGQVLWNGADLASVPVHKRNFGFMFQDYALFPHRNVFDNVAYGLRMQGQPEEAVKRRSLEMLEAVQMQDFARRQVTDLSGGEQQRVALARTLAPQPRLLMLDEPLGALDRALRAELLEELRGLLQRLEIPAIYVTHDQEEAFAIADRMALLHGGRIEQIGPPQEVFTCPASPWAARFLGMSNLLPGRLLEKNRVETPAGIFAIEAQRCTAFSPGQTVSLLLRPHARLAGQQDSANRLTGRVLDCVFQGETFRATLALPTGQRLQFQLESAAPVGGEIQVWLDPRELSLLESE